MEFAKVSQLVLKHSKAWQDTLRVMVFFWTVDIVVVVVSFPCDQCRTRRGCGTRWPKRFRTPC